MMLDLNKIAKKWQKKWEESNIFKVKEDSKKNKYYVLEMFPYTSSSSLHIGHVRNYAIGDVIARFKRMNNFNVLYPMGYDSFGLPAEIAAKKEGIHPKKYTENAISKIMEFQKELGNSYDWSRVISTHKPEYYKWNQYFFLKFLEKGLVYRKKSPVNYCPKCNSTLANEEVVNGCCWRHEDTQVEEKELEQWFLKITEYADELLKDLDKLQWSDRIKNLQRKWIGKSEGVLIDFQIKGSKNKLQVFTTRPDTIFGVTFVTVSPKHPLINELTKKHKKELEELIKKPQSKEEKDKEGVFLGSCVINPFTNEEVPVYAANFVVAEYGTGAVMAVPAHDKRDFEFALKYNLPIKTVIVPKDNPEFQVKNEAYIEEGILINSSQFSNIYSLDAIKKISEFAKKNKFGKIITQFKIRDWLISRQRYWGTPIPIIYCNKCGIVKLKETDLPLLLPENINFKEKGNPLNSAKEWVEVKCPNCKSSAKRETDTMGGFVDSSWYFLRYCSSKENKNAFNKPSVSYWMPVDQYIGGIEHAVGHLIYSRFWTKVLRDLKMLNFDEPFLRLFNQGIVYKDGHKMSKSFGNVVSQTEISEKYGIDTARLFLMSVANPESDMEWSDKGVEGSYRFLQKVAGISELRLKNPDERDEHKRNSKIKKYTELIKNFKFNLAIVELMKFTDYIHENPTNDSYLDLLKMLSPFAPHLTEELWEKSGQKNFISLAKWPEYNEKLINEELEHIESLIENLTLDLKKLLELVKIKPKKAVIFVSEKWKYDFYKKLKNKLEETRDMKLLIESLKDKEHAQDIVKIIQSALKDPAKLPLNILGQNKELNAIKENINKIKKEFNLDLEVLKAESSKEIKAKQAYPSKPAIFLS